MPKLAKAAVLLAILLAVGLVVPLPRSGLRWPAYVGDLVHAPMFALFAVVAHRVARVWCKGPVLLSALATWALLAALGAASEIVQHYIGRSMSLADLSADAVGAAAGVLCELGRFRASRAARGAFFAAAGVAILTIWVRPAVLLFDCWRQWEEFPMLASFENDLELSRWQAWKCRVRRVREHATEGEWSLRADLSADTYPGVAMVWPPANWTGRQELVFDIALDDGPPLDLVFKIEDRDGRRETSDRFETIARLRPGPNQVHVALADVAAAPRDRVLDLRRVKYFQLFTIRPSRPRSIHLDNVRLR